MNHKAFEGGSNQRLRSLQRRLLLKAPKLLPVPSDGVVVNERLKYVLDAMRVITWRLTSLSNASL